VRKERVKYTIFSTDMGWMGVAATVNGVCASVLPHSDKGEAENKLLSGFFPDPEFSSEELKELELEVLAYFRGLTGEIKCQIDWSWATAFQKRVLEVVSSIPFGTVRSYGEVAYLAGCPNGARAVGQVLAANAIPVIIPCHRVIRQNGDLGGFSGAGLDVKSRLLFLEGVDLKSNKNGNKGHGPLFPVCIHSSLPLILGGRGLF